MIAGDGEAPVAFDDRGFTPAYREGDSNPYSPLRPDGFEPSASTIPPPRPAASCYPMRPGFRLVARGVAFGTVAGHNWDVTDQKANARNDADQPSDPARPRVLVAEDEALIRLDLVELLTEQGYDVVGEAADGEVAVTLARELDPDLVVMDVKMPKQDGIAAAQTIAEERIAPVVMLTAFSQRELVERAREAGAMAYVVKPFDASDVVPAIEIAMARYAEIRAVEAEVSDLEERLESRKAVDQAKGLLQQQFGMSEPEAFRWIQKSAMDMRKSMREVAEGVIELANKTKKQ